VPDPKFRQAACERLLKAGLKENQPYCVIQPTSKFVTKEWTPAGFAAVADGLQTGYGIRAVLVAGPGEMEKVRRVAEKCATAPVLVEALSIAELAWVIHGARLFIGNDSGPTHVAAALRVPVVVLFGSSDSQVWYPWKTPFQIVQNPFDCNPCPGYRCLVYDEPKCILGLTVPQVNDALARFLETRTGQPASSS
jgi:heptosyltransferase-3